MKEPHRPPASDVTSWSSGRRLATQRFHHHGPLSITKLYNRPAHEADTFDLAEVNLISGAGLPGSEDLNIGEMLDRLDGWAKGAGDHTIKSAHRFNRNRAKFGGSIARFRMTMAVQYLTRECGIHYSPDRMKDPDNFEDPADSFIHGLLGPRRTGTCASLPVLLTAFGRRMGYPLKLVHAPAHCFCRWDTPDERFNMEWHEGGLNSHPDEFYHEWPIKWTPQMHAEEAKNPSFLQSLTPQQEWSYCAQTRAQQLDIVGRREEALQAMRLACRLWPTYGYRIWVTHLTTKALHPERVYPRRPCEETAGRLASDRLVIRPGAMMVASLDQQRLHSLKKDQTCT